MKPISTETGPLVSTIGGMQTTADAFTLIASTVTAPNLQKAFETEGKFVVRTVTGGFPSRAPTEGVTEVTPASDVI